MLSTSETDSSLSESCKTSVLYNVYNKIRGMSINFCCLYIHLNKPKIRAKMFLLEYTFVNKTHCLECNCLHNCVIHNNKHYKYEKCSLAKFVYTVN